MEKYEKLEKIGEGTFGKVYKAIDRVSGKLVALKKFRIKVDDGGIHPLALREISLLQMLSDSIYVVRLLAVEFIEKNNKKSVYLVFEYLDGDLSNFMKAHMKGSPGEPLPHYIVQSFIYQICKGVAHCHGHGVLHRDLKTRNILVDLKTGVLKIADLGLGRAFCIPIKAYSQEVVSLFYRAPELLLGSASYSTGVDMWSVGCIFAEMIRLEILFAGDSEFNQLLLIFKLLGTPTDEQWPGVRSLPNWHIYPEWKPQDLAQVVPQLGLDGIDLLSRMLKYDPAARISAKEALDHPYFDSLDRSQF